MTVEKTNQPSSTSSPKNTNTALARVLLVDPSLFTAPYDTALSVGLEAIGIETQWAVRGLRRGEEDELGASRSLPFFYPITDGARRRAGGPWRALKGIEHGLGMRALLRLVRTMRFDLVHFQWLLVPAIDKRAMQQIRRFRPVVLTVHDTTPFNGKSVSRLQRDGFEAALANADRLIVHTSQGREALLTLGLDPARIAIVPHGLLPRTKSDVVRQVAGRWRIVQFGKLQSYKGLDVLIEAIGLLDASDRARISVVVAGEAMMDVAPLLARARELGITADSLDIRLGRLTTDDMDDLFADADAFVFPYHAIEASGVLFLVASLGKWLIASDLGAFSELIGRGGDVGTLVAPGDPAALAAALRASIGERPTRDLGASVPDWTSIARATRQVYLDAQAAWRTDRASQAA